LFFFVFSYLLFFRFPYILFCCYIDRSDKGEEEEPEAHGPAPTRTSNTLVLSEERHLNSEASPPPQHNLEAPTPVPSPLALKPKKAKTGAASTDELATGSTSGPLFEDVSFLFLFVAFCLAQKILSPLTLVFFLVNFLQPLMKELVNLGSRFIGFRDEAANLRGKTFAALDMLHVPILILHHLTPFVQMHSVVPKSAPTIWKPSSEPAKQLAKRLKRRLPLSKIFARGFKPPEMV
jgi:hypothetical protein